MAATAFHPLRTFGPEAYDRMMAFYPDEKDRQYREGLFASRRFWIGFAVTGLVLVQIMGLMMLARFWFG